MPAFDESVVEQAALAWLESAGWRVAHGPENAPDMPAGERMNYGEVVLVRRLRDALARLNPRLRVGATEEAFRKVTRPEGPELVACNRLLHRLVRESSTCPLAQARSTLIHRIPTRYPPHLPHHLTPNGLPLQRSQCQPSAWPPRCLAPKGLSKHRGRKAQQMLGSPPSEPYGRISRIRLSG